MTIWQRIAREPNALTGVVIAVYGALVAFGVLELTIQETGALGVLGGALIFALRWITTPAGEVVASQRPDQPLPVAGPASVIDDGKPVAVIPDQGGAIARE